eukprot:TRINITY_DN1001_c0_g1_i1.p1 TRINITY_DN1001_c0_g1~~TRINITY_DN1001_c0_g1_i1.p1  ORF type:complete len:1403 (+),score=208.78 TRINITY_DN1001_c0_g1_i1:12466-16674(+)
MALISLPITTLNNPLTRKCFALLLKVLNVIESSGFTLKKHVKEYDAGRKNMIERVLTILDAFAQYSILAEADRKILKTPSKRIKVETLQKKPQEQPKRKQESESEAFEHGFSLIKGDKMEQYNYFENVARYANFKDLLLKGLVLSGNLSMQHAFAEEIMAIYRSFKGKDPNHAHAVLIPYMVQTMVMETLEREVNCEQFYKLLCGMIKDSSKAELLRLPVNFKEEIKAISNYIKGHGVKENKSTDTDYVIIGLMDLLAALAEKFPEEKECVGQEYEIVREVLQECLFEFPKSGNRAKAFTSLPPKCKSQPARRAAFNLLSTLCCDSPKNLIQTLSYLTPIHANAAWRTKRISDWNIIPESGDKSTTGYVGLKNLGCICYMNSLLQQFYMIPSFRNDVLSVVDPKKETNPDENVLFQTQCLFSALTESVKQYYNPKIFCHALKDWEGKSINVLEQMDVDEFFNLFLDRLETSIKNTPQQDTIKKHFGGIFANQLLCKDCPHSSVREEPFLALNLQVKNKKSLQQCLESFVEGEMLQGSNAYHCEKCDKKVTTLKRTCIKRLPKHLICVLKRFDINYDTMQKFKINEYCEFPMKINMENYTEEGLARKDKEKEREKARKEGRDLDESTGKKEKEYPKEYYEYKLTGVVIHIGTADAGHYYSLIMDREKEGIPENERWYEFNDTMVDNYNPDEIKEDAFGGEERLGGVEGWKSLGKIRNAYLLFYERASTYEPPEDDDDESSDKVTVIKKQEKPQCPTETIIPTEIHKAIEAENIKYWYNKFMFHDDYFNFALNLALTWNSSENVLEKYPSKNVDYHLLNIKEDISKTHGFQSVKHIVPKEEKLSLSLEDSREASMSVAKYVLTVLLTTVCRSKAKESVPDFIDISKAYLNKHPKIAQWLLWQFSNGKVISEFLLESCEIEMRRAAVGLLYCAMLRAFVVECSVIVEADPEKSKLINFANCWFNQLPGCRKYTIHFEQFFQIISRLSFLGPEIRQSLLKMGALRRLLGFWSSDNETKWNDFSDVKYTENERPELGLPSAVDERFQSPFEELYAARREKLYQEAEPSYTFLLEAISLLLRSTGFNEKAIDSPYCMKGFQAGLEECVKSIVLSPKTINGLIADCRSNLANVALVQALVHISWENMEAKYAIIRGITLGMIQSEWDGLRKYFYFFKEMLRHKDSMQSVCTDMAQKELLTALFSAKKAYYATFYSIKFVLCLAQEVPLVAEWCNKNPDKWEWMFTWLENNPYPSFEHKETRPFRSPNQNVLALTRGTGIITAEEQATWKNITGGYVSHLDQLKKGLKLDIQEEIGSNETLYYEKFFNNQIVECNDLRAQSWDRSIVKRVLDEMLYLQPEHLSERYAEWVEVEANNIAKAGTHTVGKPTVEEGSKDPYSSDDSPLDDDLL